MSKVNVKVRGIYSTALTKIFTDSGFFIVQPSADICRRFNLQNPRYYPVGVTIKDKEDKQGVTLQGDAEPSELIIKAMKNYLPDMIVKQTSLEPENETQVSSTLASWEVEFPYLSKSCLDQLRASIIPTVRNHHRFRIFASQYLDLMERELTKSPYRQHEIEKMLHEKLLFDYFQKGSFLEIEHVRPDFELINLCRGEITEFDPEKTGVKIKRKFKEGRYDGLDIPIEPGDYAITEAKEGDWILRHAYYSSHGSLKGIFYNINTPIEFYPGRIRYIDLHLDVVKWPDQTIKIVDKEKLDFSVQSGWVDQRLADKAIQIAENLASTTKEVKIG
ncbi:MAG: DUF402 domain-containing protein [bacterium]